MANSTKPNDTVPTRYKNKRGIEETNKVSEYPDRAVEVSASGFSTVYNEEPGNESKEEYHISGWMRITYPDGTIFEGTPGEVKVEMGGSSVTIKNNMDMNVGGNLKQQVEGGLWLEIAGTTNITSQGSAAINIMGDAGISVDGNANLLVKGNMNLDAQGNMKLKAKGGLDLGADGGIKIQGQSIAMQHAGDGTGGYRS
jgi:hypothetical protein